MMRSGSISPSTSIRSSDSENSDDTSRYAGMSAEELSTIWERRNLAYFDRRQRKLAEERQQQQQQDLSEGDDYSVNQDSCSCSSSSGSDHEQLGDAFAASASVSSSSSSSQGGQQLTRPAGFVCAADDPQWQAMTSRNMMGEYDPERARTEIAYHDAWVSCERLVNMRRSGANAAAGNFIPTNPRLAALMEQRRLEVARERYEEALRQFSQAGGAHQPRDSNSMMLDASQAPSPFASLSAQQAAEQERMNQANRSQQQELAANAQGNDSNLKTPSIESSAGEKSVPRPVNKPYYMALPYPTQQLHKSVYCHQCNYELFTSPLAKRFFCQTCGSIARVPEPNVDESFDEKMQDAEDQDYQNMSYY